MIDIRHKVFAAVARQQSFTKAADVLFITQPAISKHIRLLEATYQTQLFERKGLHIQLTPAGTILFHQVQRLQQIEEETVFRISRLNDQAQARGYLKLGASTTVALYILPRVMSAFHHRHPLIHITLLNRNAELILKALLENEIDLGITEEKGKLSSVQYQSFLRDNVIAVVGKKAKAFKNKRYLLADLTGFPVALRERGSGTLEALKTGLQKHGIKLSDLRVTVRLGGTEALKNFIIESDCIGFLPERSVLKELHYGMLKKIEFDGLEIQRSFYFIQRKGDSNALNRQFIKLARATYNREL